MGKEGAEMGRSGNCVTNKLLWGAASVVFGRTQINTCTAFKVRVWIKGMAGDMPSILVTLGSRNASETCNAPAIMKRVIETQ